MPSKNFYFPHRFAASRDPRLARAEMAHGLVAYALFFKLLELLGESGDADGYFEFDAALLGHLLRCEQLDVLRAVVVDFGLFDVEFDEDDAPVRFRALDAAERAARRAAASEAGKRGGRPRKNPASVAAPEPAQEPAKIAQERPVHVDAAAQTTEETAAPETARETPIFADDVGDDWAVDANGELIVAEPPGETLRKIWNDVAPPEMRARAPVLPSSPENVDASNALKYYSLDEMRTLFEVAAADRSFDWTFRGAIGVKGIEKLFSKKRKMKNDREKRPDAVGGDVRRDSTLDGFDLNRLVRAADE